MFDLHPGRRGGHIRGAASVVLLAAFPLLGLAVTSGPHPLAAQSGSSAAAGVPADTASTAVTASDTVRYVFDPIVVTGERELSIPPPVATFQLTTADLLRAPAENPWDLLRRTAQLEVRDPGQGPGFAANAVLRGFASDHSSEVLLIVDGVPVNLPVHGHAEGFADWNLLFPGAIRTMRIVHGPSSPYYGDFALGGTIEVFTQADREGATGGGSFSSFGDAEGWALVGHRSDTGGSLAGLQVRRIEGWRDNADFLLGNALIRGWREVGNGARLEGGLALHRAGWNSPGYVSVSRYNAGDLKSAVDPTDGGDQTRAVVQGRYGLPLAGDRFLQVSGWALASDWELFLHVPGHGEGQRGEHDRRVGAGVRIEHGWTPEWGEFTVGAEGGLHDARYDLKDTEERNEVRREVSLEANRGSGALYARWRRVFDERLGVDLGGRLDAVRVESRNRLGDASSASTSHTALVVGPKLGARYVVGERTSVLASLSRGLRSSHGVIGNPTREPLTAWAAEVGSKLQGDRLSGSASLFRIHVDNERILDPVTGQTTPEGSSVRQGVEARLLWGNPDALHLEVGGNYTHSRMDGAFSDPHGDHGHHGGHHHHHHALHDASRSGLPGGEPDRIAPPDRPLFHPIEGGEGEWVPGIARWRGFVRGEWALSRTRAIRGQLRVTGPYVPVGEPHLRTDPFSVLDLGLSWAPAALGAGRWVLDLDLQNAADIRYPEIRASRFVNPGAPRSLRLGVRMAGG